jgi:hypothetical protein
MNVSEVKGMATYMGEFKFTKSVKEISNAIFIEGCIKDKTTASGIATLILKAVYGDGFDNGLPLLVQFSHKKQCWFIRTQLPDGMVGGSKYIVIKKSTAEVLGIWATK